MAKHQRSNNEATQVTKASGDVAVALVQEKNMLESKEDLARGEAT